MGNEPRLPVRVLLVEDDPAIAASVARELAAAGFVVTPAGSGEDGLRLALSELPDVIVLDWMLPGIDGLETLRRLRSALTTPVLMLTARGDETDRVLGLELGADDYLSKPFSSRELVARVRALVRRRAILESTLDADRRGAGAARAGALAVDLAAHRATRDGLELPLTRLELKLLHLLVSHPGRVFSRAYLLESVWDEDGERSDRAVDNTVVRLRRKLGPSGGDVESVWGVGYRLRVPR